MKASPAFLLPALAAGALLPSCIFVHVSGDLGYEGRLVDVIEDVESTSPSFRSSAYETDFEWDAWGREESLEFVRGSHLGPTFAGTVFDPDDVRLKS